MDKQMTKKISDGLKLTIRTTISKNEKFFGPGIVTLLHLIEELGSIQAACKKMKMSYSKAWSIIKRMEKELDFKVLETKAGGLGGGLSVLTDDTKDFLDRYDKMNKELDELSSKLFNKYFYE